MFMRGFLPQPVPYQGSKRAIAHHILEFFPESIDLLIEPFAGSAALSVAAAYQYPDLHFHLNDLNAPLMDLLETIIERPNWIAGRYAALWKAQLGHERAFYDEVRDAFNHTHKPEHFLYLLARCVKASVRYNADGDFNQSPDNRRKGRRPESMQAEIHLFSELLRGRVLITRKDYKEVLATVPPDALVYMDPPYQGTSNGKDPRYYSGLGVEEFIDVLEELNRRAVMFILSYDGRKDDRRYGRALPARLALHHLEIAAGRSTQATLLGKREITYESLYFSPALVNRLDTIALPTEQQLSFMEALQSC